MVNRKCHRIGLRFSILWTGLRVGRLQKMKPLWAQNKRLIVKLCTGTLLGVAVYTNRLTGVNMEISALYYIISVNGVLLFLRLPADITNSLPKPSLGYTVMGCEHIWAKYAPGTVMLYQKSSISLQHSCLSPLWIKYQNIYGVKPTEIMQKY